MKLNHTWGAVKGVASIVALVLTLAGCASEGIDDEYAPTAEELRGRIQWTDVCLVPRRHPNLEIDIRVPRRTANRIIRRTRSYAGPCYDYGDSGARGNGTLTTYAQYADDGSPLALGVTFPASTLTGLPTAMTDGNHCFDVNGDGLINNGPMDTSVDPPIPMECMGGHESILYLPDSAIADADIPFEWMLINYNTMGHPPPGIYDSPHFDFHFYILDQATRDSIGAGTCELLIDCAQIPIATAPIPPQYQPVDYTSVGAAEVAMGDHLVDLTSNEFVNPGSFDHTWIYGAWDGSVAFYEPMITVAYFQTQPDLCVPLKLPAEWETAGYYPLEYCMRYRPNRDDYTVSMESFVYRPAT